MLDGFPLAEKGQAARALSAACTSSLRGWLAGALFLTLVILVARPIVLAFGLPEMLMMTLLGLSMVAVLAGRVALKGLAAAASLPQPECWGSLWRWRLSSSPSCGCGRNRAGRAR